MCMCSCVKSPICPIITSTLPVYQHRFSTTNAEFNGECFKAYRMLILHLEQEIFIIMKQGVICTHMVDFAGPVTIGHNYKVPA